MAKHAVRATACFAFLFALLMMSGCIARGPVMSASTTELVETPFYPQKKFQCGPAALATVLAASGVATTPDALAPSLYIPARRGSLQVEMRATPRTVSRLAVPLPRNPESIVAELEGGRPVLVLHNYGLSFWPRWHYAVVVGYDPRADVFILRSGLEPRQRMRTRRFMVAWHHAGRWAMVVLRPGETPALDDATTYLEAAADFEASASPTEARAAFDAAVRRWPSEATAYIGRGTAAYRLGDLRVAAHDYAQALRLDPANIGARNNLAQTLLDLHCPARARRLLDGIDVNSLPPAARAAVLDTRSQSALRSDGTSDAADCTDIP